MHLCFKVFSIKKKKKNALDCKVLWAKAVGQGTMVVLVVVVVVAMII